DALTGVRRSLRRRVVPTRRCRARPPRSARRGGCCFPDPKRKAEAREQRSTMERAAKEQILGEIKEAFANVASVVIADYRGIRVPTVTKMRDDFRSAGCQYRVLNN